MRLQLGDAALLAMLSASLHWIIARSKIAQPLWSRARGRVDALLSCPACSGFWLGLGLGAAGLRPVDVGQRVTEVALAGVLAVFLTPVAEGALIWGLERSAVSDAPSDTDQSA